MKKLTYFLFILLVVIITGCEPEDNPVDTGQDLTETELLINYLESNGDFINNTAPVYVSAEQVKNNLTTSKAEYLIDLRSSVEFLSGHIDGAKNLLFRDLISHVKSVKDSGYAKIVLICYSGQISSYGASVLRLLGYNNVYSMKWGMSAWNQVFANDYWSANKGNSYSSQFVTTSTPKSAKGELPVLNTGKKTGKEILEIRAAQLISEGFGTASISNSALFQNLSNYYVVNYWPSNQYSTLGHINGAVQFTPGNDLKLSTNLKTLPNNKTIAVYCYTGETSAFIAAYLKLLGYDVKSVYYGANGMAYDKLAAGGSGYDVFKQSDIKDYPYTSGK